MEKVDKLYKYLSPCTLCPRNCKSLRDKGEVGFCKVTDKPMVSSFGPHFGEEPVLVGFGGSGTIFFTGCNLECVFCQNYQISHLMEGEYITVSELSDIMIYLEEKGCHNINLVSPTHQIPQVFSAVEEAKRKGLKIPIVYNCGGYENIKVLRELQGLVDIYMPDVKTFNHEFSKKYLKAPDYPEIVKETLLEMKRQVGHLKVNEYGLAEKGLMIRHLVMPGWIEDSKEILRWIAENLGKETYVNVMEQYFPFYKACDYPEICRKTTEEEFNKVYSYAKKLGLRLAV
ncbi:Radical SAM domain protein [Desulfurobacterium thermolithotrophum DSM 11699]|uniref:Radical SAM domain protein n=1 Tax=Desulfurobacterium thermolithotrophum (strain DSM 11699 / BSA) TaxID=868864 RepID=F0S1H5_DESTD|nr:radical SAM protein [Desulfurobacterium thermolithotrophum]ADY73978.1 Radical SAM domain protein [Desulfurobacterium thermolithotrophum DSM 11699]